MKDVYIGIVYKHINQNLIEVKIFSNHFGNENPSVFVYKDSKMEVEINDDISFEKKDDGNYYLLSKDIEEIFCKILFIQYFEDLNKAFFIVEIKHIRHRILIESITEELKLAIPGDILYIYKDKGEVIRVELKYRL